jgi:3-oxoacyl-[acyl-carrier-protein] synthase II
MEKRRVVVTGIGVVSPVGSTLESFWASLSAGVSGIDRITAFDASEFSSQIAGQVTDLDINDYVPRKEQRRMDRYCQFAMAAASQAMADAAIGEGAYDPDRMGCTVGAGIGGLQTLEKQHTTLLNKGPSRLSPFMIPMMINNMAAGMIAIEHNLKGPNFGLVTACATAAHSLGDAMHIIRRGDADVMVAGGAEAAICPLGIGGFCAMKAVSSSHNDDPKTASRPFDIARDGFVMGEGAGVLVLEEMESALKRGATIYGEVAGFGMSCDAFHMTAPAETGEGAARAIKMAYTDAGIDPSEVDYINAHGTSTPLNDKIETRAIKAALGEDNARKLAVSSTKSMTGHLLGAAAGVESAACLMAMKTGLLPPTINYDTPDPECDLDYVPNTARKADVKVCLNNSLGFGGHNACVCFKAV